MNYLESNNMKKVRYHMLFDKIFIVKTVKTLEKVKNLVKKANEAWKRCMPGNHSFSYKKEYYDR